MESIDLKLVLGGFGLFMIGMTLLGDSLKETAGPKIKVYIEKYTSNIFMAIMVGMVITALIQSSSAATVISISLVRAGLMSLEQAIGVSIGTNIGTTVTSIIVGLKIDGFGYYFVFAGALLYVFTNSKKLKNIGYLLFSFGITFAGLMLMGDQLGLLQNYPQFIDFINFISQYKWLAFVGGILATAIINSSSAFIAIVQKLFGSGVIGLPVVISMVLGSNIGTTVTAYIASLGGSVSTRRASIFHTIFNLIGAIIIMLLITPYTALVSSASAAVGGSSEFTVAIAHFFFNLIFAILVIPFVPAFMKLLKVIVPGEDRVYDTEIKTVFDINTVQEFPEAAMDIARQGIEEMGQFVYKSIKHTEAYFKDGDISDYNNVTHLENIINQLDTNLTNYLLEIARAYHNPGLHIDDYTKNLEIVKNLERIGDLNLNLVGFFHLMNENGEEFSYFANEELQIMIEGLLEILDETLNIFLTQDASSLEQVFILEEKLDSQEYIYRGNHFERLREGICYTPVASSIYVDILSTLERMADHSVNASRFVDNVTKVHETKEIY